MEPPDHLRNLTDCLLHSILSCLSSTEVVQTTLLSSRWWHTWRSMLFIDIDQREFSTPEKFEDFADGLISLRCFSTSAPLLLLFSVYAGKVPMERWIRCVLTLPHLALLDIHFGGAKQVNLNLWRSFLGRHLTALHLDRLCLAHHWGQLSSVFSVLEDLRIRRCSLLFDQIKSTTLKNLSIDGCTISFQHNKVLVLVAPGLTSLRLVHHLRRYRDAMIGIYVTSVNSMPSLERASVRIVDPRNALGMKDKQVHERGLWFLKSLGNLLLGYLTSVMILELLGFPTMALIAEVEQKEFPSIQNLETLLLHECGLSNDLQMIRNLLHNALNLKKLALHHCKILGDSISTKNKRKGGRAGPKETTTRAEGHKVMEIECGHGDVRQLANDLLDVFKDQAEECDASMVFTMPNHQTIKNHFRI